MIKKMIEIDGNQYVLGKKIKENGNLYIEYRNTKIGKMKFFKIKNGNMELVIDKDELKKIVEKNYILKKDI